MWEGKASFRAPKHYWKCFSCLQQALDQPQHEVYPCKMGTLPTQETPPQLESRLVCQQSTEFLDFRLLLQVRNHCFSSPAFPVQHDVATQVELTTSFSRAFAQKGKLFKEKVRRVSQRLEDSFAVRLIIKCMSPFATSSLNCPHPNVLAVYFIGTFHLHGSLACKESGKVIAG